MDDQILTIRRQIHLIESRAPRIALDQCGEYFRRLDYWGDELNKVMGWKDETV